MSKDFLLEFIIAQLGMLAVIAIAWIVSGLTVVNWVWQATAHLGLVGEILTIATQFSIAAVAGLGVMGFILWRQNRPRYGAW